jgi:tryptophanyl-tRNA synthetase
MLDPPETIRKKVQTAVTDSGTDVRYDPEQKAGISNLIEIMSVATGKPIAEIEREFDGSGYGAFKGAVAEAIVELLRPITQRYQEIRSDEPGLQLLLARGADKAREASAPTLAAMYDRMGFARP